MKYVNNKNNTSQVISARSNGLDSGLPEKITIYLAQFISVVYAPFLVPTYLFIFLFSFFPELSLSFSPSQKVLATSGIFIATTILPMLLVFVLYKLEKIDSILLEKKEERRIPQIFSCLLYLIITIGLTCTLGLSHVLTLVMCANTISLIFISLITPYWKISTHACGAFGCLSILICMYLKFPDSSFEIPLFIVFVLSFLVGIARIYLRVHTPLQVLCGGLLGAFIGGVLFY